MASAIRHGGTFFTILTTAPSRSMKARSRSKRMNAVWTAAHGVSTNAFEPSRLSRPSRPRRRARRVAAISTDAATGWPVR